jgi:phage anti-repressor protein
MNQELIPVVETEIDGDLVETCNARDLHAFLGVKRDFSNWIKIRINQYKFEVNVDYLKVIAKSGENPLGGRPEQEYHLTLDMAKELAMVENNDQGRQVRRYFIERERQALAVMRLLAEQAKELNEHVKGFEKRISRLEQAHLTGGPRRQVETDGVKYEEADYLDRETWFTPTELGGRLKLWPSKVGVLLRMSGLHGEYDLDHKHSEPYLREGRRAEIAYLYNPAVVMPALKKLLSEL